MYTMKAVIIEDEEIIARVLQQKIEHVAPEIDIVQILPSLKTSRRWFAEHAEPDLLFMDVQLSDGVSLELFQHVQLSCPVIFTTAYDEYAIQAFKNNGVDYLLKPINEGELQQAIQKCKALIQKQAQAAPQELSALFQAYMQQGQTNRYKEKFVASIRNQWVPINVAEVSCFMKESLNYLYHLNGDRYILDYNALDEIEELLDPRQFYRANRQCIINIEAIAGVKSMEGSKLLVRLKEPNHKLEIDISRLKSAEFRKWMDR